MVEVGSMEVVGIYKDAGLFASLEGTRTRIKESVNQAKTLKEETHLLQKVAQEAAASFGEIAIESKEVEKLKETIEEAIPDVKDIIIKTKVEGTEETEDLKEIYEEAAAAAQNFGGLQFGGLVDSLEDSTNKSKSLKEEMKRLNVILMGASATAAVFGSKLLSIFTNAITSSPYLLGALTKMKTYFQLLGWAITKHLKPALDWFANQIKNMYKWYMSLNDTSQKVVMWTLLIGSAFLVLSGTIITLALALKALGLGGLLLTLQNLASWLAATASGIVSSTAFVLAMGAAIGTLIGLLAVLALDKLGILDWISDLGRRFRQAREKGSLLADTLTLILSPLALLGDLFLVLVTNKTMKNFWEDVDTVTQSLKNLWNATKKLFDLGFPEIGSYASGTAYPGRAIGSAVIASTGLYEVHAGEEIIPANSSRQTNRNPETNIILDFAGAEINLASGIDLDSFAGEISRKIADQQSWGAY